MGNLSKDLGTAVLIITHNLGVVARYADRVNVMYAGRIIESSTAENVFHNPQHGYTVGLMASVPRLDDEEHVRLATIEGQPPLLIDEIHGCAFQPRCPKNESCFCSSEGTPELTEISPGHWVADCPCCMSRDTVPA